MDPNRHYEGIERALRELELDELAAGRGPNYAQRVAMMRSFDQIMAEQLKDGRVREMLESARQQRLDALVSWLASTRSADG